MLVVLYHEQFIERELYHQQAMVMQLYHQQVMELALYHQQVMGLYNNKPNIPSNINYYLLIFHFLFFFYHI